MFEHYTFILTSQLVVICIKLEMWDWLCEPGDYNLKAGRVTIVTWKQWEMVMGYEKIWWIRDLEGLSKHLFVFRWQRNQFRAAKAAVSDCLTVALAICDLPENFVCKHQDKVQSAQWGSVKSLYTQQSLKSLKLWPNTWSLSIMIWQRCLHGKDHLGQDHWASSWSSSWAVQPIQKQTASVPLGK